MPDHKYQKRERLPHLLETLPVGVYHTSLKGKIIKANMTLVHMLGYTSFSELENFNIKDLYAHSKDWENHLKMLETTKTSTSNIKIQCKDGHTLRCRDYPKMYRAAASRSPSGRYVSRPSAREMRVCSRTA